MSTVSFSELEEWYKLYTQLREIKEKEAHLRRQICGNLIDEQPDIHSGKVQYKDIIGSFKIKAEQALYYKLDTEVLADIWDILTEDELDCIKLKPELVVVKLKKLDEDSILWSAVVTKPAMPTLTLNPV